MMDERQMQLYIITLGVIVGVCELIVLYMISITCKKRKKLDKQIEEHHK